MPAERAAFPVVPRAASARCSRRFTLGPLRAVTARSRLGARAPVLSVSAVSDRPPPKIPLDATAREALLARVEDAISLLDAFIEDRAQLVDVPEDARQRLLMSAGRVSRPARGEARKLAKAFRKRERHDVRAEDEAVLDDTGIRALRRAPVFPTPSLAAIPPVRALAGGHDPAAHAPLPAPQRPSRTPRRRTPRRPRRTTRAATRRAR